MADLSRSIRLKHFLVTPCEVSYNPRKQAFWFGLIPFRSPLLGKSQLLSLPPGTEMFQFPGSASFTLCIEVNVLFHYEQRDRKSTRLNSSHVAISYAVFCLKKKNQKRKHWA